MMRPVILSMPVNSATGLVRRSADADVAMRSPAARSDARAKLQAVIQLPDFVRCWPRRSRLVERGSKRVAKDCGDKSPLASAAGRPGVIVAAAARPPVVAQDGALRTVSLCTAGEIRNVRFLPLARLVVLFRRRRVDAMMNP